MKKIIQFVFSMAAVMGAISADAQAGHCWKTAELAVIHNSNRIAEEGNSGSGFRLRSVRRDALTGSPWALVEACGHPEWPLRAVKFTGTPMLEIAQTEITKTEVVAMQPPLPIVVHVGDVVEMTSEDDRVHVQISGMAEQNARVGEQIAVRVERRSADEGLRVEHLHGVVLGPGAVSLQQQ